MFVAWVWLIATFNDVCLCRVAKTLLPKKNSTFFLLLTTQSKAGDKAWKMVLQKNFQQKIFCGKKGKRKKDVKKVFEFAW